MTAAIVSSNDGHHDGLPPGYDHEADQGHNGSYRPVQMYSTVQSNSSDPAASQQTQVTPRRIGRREKPGTERLQKLYVTQSQFSPTYTGKDVKQIHQLKSKASTLS